MRYKVKKCCYIIYSIFADKVVTWKNENIILHVLKLICKTYGVLFSITIFPEENRVHFRDQIFNGLIRRLVCTGAMLKIMRHLKRQRGRFASAMGANWILIITCSSFTVRRIKHIKITEHYILSLRYCNLGPYNDASRSSWARFIV